MTMPTFVVIGFERSGTTSCHYSLAQHPEVLMSCEKEPNYWIFDRNGEPPSTMPRIQAEWMKARSGRTREAYERLFSDAGPQHKAFGDVSPLYSHYPNDIAPRLCAELPDVKLVAIIRHPVDHARSIVAHWHNGRQPTMKEFTAALLKNQARPDRLPKLREYGDYARWLSPFYEWFPRRQIKILLFDRLKTDLLLDLQEFIGVIPMPSLPLLHYNASGASVIPIPPLTRTKRLIRAVLPTRAVRQLMTATQRFRMVNTNLDAEPMPPELKAELTERFYRQSIADTERLTGLDLSAWRNGNQEPMRAVA